MGRYRHCLPAKYLSLLTCAVAIFSWISLSSCTERDDSKVADAFTFEILSPWWLRPESKEAELAQEFRAMAKNNRADPRRIPTDVVTRVAAMTDIKADSLTSLLTVTGLVPHQEHLFIVFLGTLHQELWVYYRNDAALFAYYDPVSRTILGDVHNYSPER